MTSSGTTPVRLKALLRERHWQTYRTFCAEYDRAAKAIDPDLVGTWPSRAQFARWLSGDLKGLPYPDHCRILEKMLPGWTAAELFEPEVPQRAIPTVDPAQEAQSPSVSGSDTAGPLEDSLQALKEARGFSDEEISQLAKLAGNVVEMSIDVDIDIDADGWARLSYRHELLNLTDRPLTRLAREMWFEYTRGPLIIRPAADSERRIVIQRIHDTANLAKFACQLSPPLKTGELASIAYTAEGGQFVEDHYWRQSLPRYTGRLAIRIRHRKAGQLIRCAAIEQHADGAENSADDTLIWDYEGDDAVMTVNRERLRPDQAITLRWDLMRDA